MYLNFVSVVEMEMNEKLNPKWNANASIRGVVKEEYCDNSGISLPVLHKNICCESQEALLMSTHKIHFYGEIRKIITKYSSQQLLISHKLYIKILFLS